MQKNYNTVIIGGGASGLICAVELVDGKNALSANDVVILERNDRVGKKLVATGNGQGNLMNENFTAQNYYGDLNFINAFIEKQKSIDLKNYFYELGIPLSSSKEGKLYPLSKQASSVLDTIRAFLSAKGVAEETGKKVTEIIKEKDGFTVVADKVKYSCKNVVFAVGGSAGKQFGTDGSAYKLIEKFGHKKTALFPSLVQLKTQTDAIKGLKGLKETARVTAFCGGKPLKSSTGDLLFTDFGVSGSTIFNVSASIADKTDAYLIVEFLPELSFSEVEKILKTRDKKKYVKKEDLLCGVLNKRIGQAVIKSAKSKELEDIAYAIKNFKLKVTGSLDFSYAQVTRGGIKTDKIDKDTYESKLCSNLFVVGEVLDVDGDCGGYNLAFAFTSGITCAREIKNRKGN